MNFNIFNTDFNNQSVPQKSWLYRVLFFSEDESNAEIMTNANTKIIVLKATLPKVETKIVTQNFMNTKKSFPIARDYSGTTTLEFQLKSESSENEYIKKLFGIYQLGTGTEYWVRPEFNQVFNKIHLALNNDNDEKYNDSENTTFSGNEFILYNCIVQNVTFNEISYASSEALSFSVEIHYDHWTLS